MPDDPTAEGTTTPRPKSTKKPKAAVGNVSPLPLPDEKARQGEHKRQIERERAIHDRARELQTLSHDQALATETSRHRRRMEWAMIGVGVLTCVACIGIGIAPKLSDDLKKTIIGFFGIFLSGGLGLALGRASNK